jgi:hypothetical protein
MSKKEEDAIWGWVVILILAIIFFIGLIFRNCVFIWPPRWGFTTCCKEQWHPAIEKAVKFPEVNK